VIHGRVVGEIWSTVKVPSLSARKLLIVRPEPDGGGAHAGTTQVVAVDCVHAGVGDRVIVAMGQAARHAIGDAGAAIEAAVIAVVDGFRVDDSALAEGVDSPPRKKASLPRKKTSRRKKTKTEKPRAEVADLFPNEEDASSTEPEDLQVISDETDAESDLPDFDAVEDVWKEDEES